MKDGYCRFKGFFFGFFSVVLFFISLSTRAVEPGYQVELIQAQPLETTVIKTGKITYKRTLNLSFKSSGYLTAINADEGEYFTQGSILAALDTTELNEQKNSTYARLLQAKREVARVQSLLAKKLSSEKELDIAKTLVETSRADYKVAYYNLEKAQLIAPFDGIVLSRNSELGELQSPQNIALTVAATSNNLIVKLALTAEEISMVQLKQRVKVDLGIQGVVTGHFSKLPAMADLQSNMFHVEVLLPLSQREDNIVVGKLVGVFITNNSENLVYALPISALNKVNKQGKALITVIKENQKVQQSFNIDKLTNDFIFLAANVNEPALNVITQGWQGLTSNADTETQ